MKAETDKTAGRRRDRRLVRGFASIGWGWHGPLHLEIGCHLKRIENSDWVDRAVYGGPTSYELNFSLLIVSVWFTYTPNDRPVAPREGDADET